MGSAGGTPNKSLATQGCRAGTRLHVATRPPETTGVIPETRYAKTADGINIAYEALGDGPVDLVAVPSWISNVEKVWELEPAAAYFRRLAEFSRLIMLDKRERDCPTAFP